MRYKRFAIMAVILPFIFLTGCLGPIRYQCKENGLTMEMWQSGSNKAIIKIRKKSSRFTDTIVLESEIEVLKPFHISVPTDDGKDIYILAPYYRITEIDSHDFAVHVVYDAILDRNDNKYEFLWVSPELLHNRENLEVNVRYCEIKKN